MSNPNEGLLHAPNPNHNVNPTWAIYILLYTHICIVIRKRSINASLKSFNKI